MIRYLWGVRSAIFLFACTFSTAVHAGITAPATSTGDYTVSWTQYQTYTEYGLWESVAGGSSGYVFFDQPVYSHAFTSKPAGTYTYDVNYCYLTAWPGLIRVCVPTGYPSATVVVGPPAAPGSFAPEASEVFDGEVDFTWDASSGATSYTIEKKPDGGSWSTAQSGITGTSTTISSLVPDSYDFRIIACASIGCGDPSASVAVGFEDLANLSPTPTIATSVEAGSIPFSTGVSHGGDATIAIPIRTPDGPGGLKANLAVTYSSGGGRELADAKKFVGTLGYGWALAGVPEMRRCRTGKDENNIALDSSDRVCLGNEPLVQISGLPWAEGAEYRTEKQTFVRVYAKGSSTSNRWFEVHLPNGHVREYGNTPGSAVAPVGTTTRAIWGMNKETDDFGNVLEIAWEDNDLTGTNYPTAITYGDAEVKLFYEQRDDAESVSMGAIYYNGTFTRKVALNRVDVEVDGTKVREYRLKNAESAAGALRLDQLQLCGYAEGGGSEACLGALDFGWDAPPDAPGETEPPPEFEEVVETITSSMGDDTSFVYYTMEGDSTSNHARHTWVPWHFGTYSQPSTVETRSEDDRVVVEERNVPDGNGGTREYQYWYHGYPLYTDSDNTDPRGFVGFPVIREVLTNVPTYDPSVGTSPASSFETFRQYRLEFPFIGTVSRYQTRKWSPVSDAFVKLEVGYIGWEETSQHNDDVTFPYLARSYIQRYTVDGSYAAKKLSLQSTEHTYCHRTLSGSTCPGSGTEGEFPTQIVSVTEHGQDLSGTPSQSSWGEVGETATSGVVAYEDRTLDFTNHDGTTYWTAGFANRLEQGFGATSQQESFESTFTKHSNQSPEIKTAVLFDGDNKYELTITSLRNGNGNVDDTTTSGVAVTSRTATAASFLHSLYPQDLTNEEGHNSDLTYDVRFGAVDSITDANGNVTYIDRDQFGRIIEQTEPDGTEITIDYEDCADAGVDCSMITWAAPRIRVTRSTDNGTQSAPTVRSYLDEAGQEVLVETEAFSSGWNRVETHYDKVGRVAKQSLPYASGGTAKYVEYHYDHEGRVVRENRADGSNMTHDYVGGSGWLERTSTESGSNHKAYAKFDRLGRITETTDGYNTTDAVTTTYAYHYRGGLDTVTVDGTLVADMDYDIANNRDEIDEANSGVTTFTFDALGQVIQTTDAEGQKTKFTYDKIGRLEERIDGYLGSGSITNTFTWDTATNGTGLLKSQSSGDFTETFAYDTTSRLDTITATVNVTGFNDNGPYVIDYDYDAKGRVDSVTYPGGQEFTNVYTSKGYLSQVKKGTKVLHQYDAMDAFGNVTEESFANGMETVRDYDPETGRLTSIETGTSSTPKSIQDLLYAWNSNGTLDTRTDQLGTATTADDRVDTFSYDPLDRLTSAASNLPSATNRTKSYDYDDFGNLTTKTSSRAADLDATNYAYATSTKPHRLTSVTIEGVSNTLDYDLNGNVTEYDAASGDDTFIDYDPANRATKITVGATSGTSTPTARDEFWYGPNHDRYLKRSTWDDSGTQRQSWTLYLRGGVYQETLPDDQTTVDYYQVIQVTGVAEYHRKVYTAGGSDTSEAYLHRDHLGSVEAITRGSGALRRELSYDPFGSRRDQWWWRDISQTTLDNIINDHDEYGSRGFTDHEHLDRVGIIHMNGRIYDPRIGRFLQPDPFVQFPFYGQNHNRYSYVFNDPMSWVDPSGFCGGDLDFGSPCLGPTLAGFPSLPPFGGGGLDIEIPINVPATPVEDPFDPSVYEPPPVFTIPVPTGTSAVIVYSGTTRGAGHVHGRIDQDFDRSGINDRRLRELQGPYILPTIVVVGVVIVVEVGAGEAVAVIVGRTTVGSGRGTVVPNGTTPGYRAVSNAELDDIAENGFRPHPGGRSMEDKWFSESREGAEAFRNKYDDLDNIVEADVPNDVLRRSHRDPNIDGTGPGFAVRPEDQPLIRPRTGN